MSVWKWTNPNDPSAFSIIELNQAACDARQLKREDALGKSFKEIEFFDAHVVEIFQDVIHSHSPRSAGKIHYVHNRPEATYLVKVFPLFKDCVVTIFEDISQLEEVEKRLAEERKAKEEVLKLKGEMLARVSHGILFLPSFLILII